MSASHDGLVNCESCGRMYKWQSKLAGKKVRCKCGQPMFMPADEPMDLAFPLAMDAVLLPPVAAAPARESSKSSKPAPSAAASQGYCPSCKAAVKSDAVICIQCGFNRVENKKLTTQTGGVVRASTGPAQGPRRTYNSGRDGFFTRFSRSWEMAKISYGIIWDFKKLIIFPVISAMAAILVSLSFIYPFIAINASFAPGGGSSAGTPDPMMEHIVHTLMGLTFYFCNYFVIVFFNTALTACAMKITVGEAPSIRYGLSIAVKRIPQIAAWALVSAVVGQLIRFLENQKLIGKIVALVLGSGWTILTYFVVPVLCVEGVGPVKAVKGSFLTIRESWGDGLVGNMAMGFLQFIMALPLALLFGVGFFLMGNGSAGLGVILLAGSLAGFLVFLAISSAADGVFRALLYNYATGREMPADVDLDIFSTAFASKAV